MTTSIMAHNIERVVCSNQTTDSSIGLGSWKNILLNIREGGNDFTFFFDEETFPMLEAAIAEYRKANPVATRDVHEGAE